MAVHQTQEPFDEEFTVPRFSSSSEFSDDEDKPFVSLDRSIISPQEWKSTSFLILLAIGMGGLVNRTSVKEK